VNRATDPAVILAARRTPLGAFQGAFAGLTAPQLGACAIRAALADSGLAPADVDEVILGMVLSAGIGQAPARQAALGGGIPAGTPATTVNKMCGSGMRAVMLAADQILAGSARTAVAGGLESMSNAPYLLPKARAGYRMGHSEVLDHMFFDGLQSPWDGQLMGCFAEATAEKYGFSRVAQDDFACESVRRAQAAMERGDFAAEITAVSAGGAASQMLIERDEMPFKLDLARVRTLKAAFRPGGTVTAASSSGIADGAAALVLARASVAAGLGLAPIARIAGHASYAREPEWFTLAPVGAMRKLLDQLQWSTDEVDLFEINEAFAVVTMAAIRDLGLDPGKVNVNGGACALGHPIGATGARILTTLIHAMRTRGAKRGMASLCIGGGEATAVAVELP
jgi:acetyl-CoA C-acetyltransferase